MSEANLHETARQATDDITRNAGIDLDKAGLHSRLIPVTTADGQSHKVSVIRSNDTPMGYMHDTLVSRYSDTPTDMHPASIHNSEIGHAVKEDGTIVTTAAINTPAGRYNTLARTEADGTEQGSTEVLRPGYGLVSLKSPRAKVLVGNLASKSITATSEAIAKPERGSKGFFGRKKAA